MARNANVAVLMPIHNAGPHLKPAIQSLLRQTLKDFEILAFDDASTDGSLQVLQQFAAVDSRVRVVSCERQGLTRLLERGVTEARAPYIARMDSDDVCVPDRLERQVAALEQDPSLVAVGGQAMKIDSHGWALQPWRVPLDHESIDAAHIAGQAGQMIHPATTFRASVLKKTNYRSSFVVTQDYDLFLRLAEVGRLANLPEVVLKYRWHLGNVSSKRKADQVEAKQRALDEARQRRGLLPLPPLSLPAAGAGEGAAGRKNLVRMAARGGNYHTAAKHLARLMIGSPTSPEAREIATGMLRRLLGRRPRRSSALQ